MSQTYVIEVEVEEEIFRFLEEEAKKSNKDPAEYIIELLKRDKQQKTYLSTRTTTTSQPWFDSTATTPSGTGYPKEWLERQKVTEKDSE
jgi:hypothetical protein